MIRGMRFSPVRSVVITLAVALAPAAAFAQRDTWRTLRIDGSTTRAFEESVAALQNALPISKREDLEIALLTIWLSQSTQAGDLDADGALEPGDILGLKADAAALLSAIKRGDLLAAIEDEDPSDDDRMVVRYVELLDGLGHEAVLDAAARPGEAPAVAQAVKAAKAEVLCGRQELGRNPGFVVRQKWCNAHYRHHRRLSIESQVALANAVETLRAGDIAEAELAIDRLERTGLTPVQRGTIEAMRYEIAYQRQQYPQARLHLQAAVDAGALSPEVAAGILEMVMRFEQAAARPRPPRRAADDAQAPAAGTD